MSAQPKQNNVEFATSESNPGPTLTKFVSDHLKFSKIIDKSTPLPKFTFISKSNYDKKYNQSSQKINESIKTYKNKLREVTDYEERRDLEKQIENENNKLKQLRQNGLTEDVIDVSRFNFINDLIQNASVSKPEEIIDKIYDPELRGYLDIAIKTQFKSDEDIKKSKKSKQSTEATETDKEAKKQSEATETDKEAKKSKPSKALIEVINRVNFIKHAENKEVIFAKKMCEILNDVNKFKIKFFNLVFEHPKNEKDRVIYLLKVYKYMDKILEWFIKEEDKKKIYKSILSKEMEEFKNLKEYKSKFSFDNWNEIIPKWIVELELEENQKEIKNKLKAIHNTLRNSMIFYEFLSKYDFDNLKENYSTYKELIEKYMELNTEIQTYFSKNKDLTVLQIISKYIYILRKLRQLDSRPNKVTNSKTNAEKDNQNKFDNQFTKELNDVIPFKFTKSVKTKIRDCVNDDIEPEFEDENAKNYFSEADFESIYTSNKDIYNKELYAKFGTICGLKLPKHFRVAIGLRCVSELFREVNMLIMKHNNKQNFTIHIMA